MNATSIDIKDMLDDDSSLGLTFATDLFVGEIPAEATGMAVCVYDSGGYPPNLTYVYEYPAVQIKVLSAKGDYEGGHELAQACRDALIALSNTTINSARYILIKCSSDIIHLGLDKNRRNIFTVNFELHRTDA
jgi:hypothetical protein